MKRIILIQTLIIISAATLSAQMERGAGATLSGLVTDSLTSDPMEAATISVTEKVTGNVFTGTITNSEGKFTISDIPAGIYDIGITFIGYEEVSIDSVSLKGDISLGTISLTPSSFSLNEVMIVSDKPVIENRFDKIIYNVSSDITSQGSLAIDVLKKVPYVTVDANGNVELQGNSNIRFLINGKTSSIFGTNLADALASIPSSQIRSIEAITNPGAKYDLQGTGGVINIILQENNLQGASGNINLSVGTRNQTGSVNLGVKRGKFGVNGYLSGNFRKGDGGSFSSTRESTDILTEQNTFLTQEGLNRFERNGYRAGTGFEWDITDKINLAGNIGYNNFNFSNSGLVDLEEIVYDNAGNLLSGLYTVRNSSNKRETESFDWNLDFKKRFGKEGHELDFILNSSYGKPVSNYLLTLSALGDSDPAEGSESNNPGTDNTTTVTADYVYPINETSAFEAGIKGTFNDISSSVVMEVYNPASGEYVFDPLQSYDLRYTLNIYAAYLSTSLKLFNWLDIKPGLRYEYSDISIDYSGASVPSYGTLVPSLLLSHDLNENKSLQLSYSRRIRRPDYGDLNPFINRSDPYNIETGNVLLKPEVGERIELGYNTSFSKGGNLRITLAQRIDSREIDDITTFYPTYAIGDSVYRNVSVRTNENIGSEYNTGLNVFTSIPLTSKINLRSNLMLFYNYLASDRIGNISTGFRFRGNLNASWQLPSDFLLELFGFWRSGGKGIQGREPQFYIYNFALRKLFWNDNGSLGVTATNLFSRDVKQIRTITTENSISRNVQSIPFRSFGISFTYKFGKMESNQNRDNEDESFGGGGIE
jgi:outer membrane receptor protein involved in Fe transport